MGRLPLRHSHSSKHENLIQLYPEEHFIAHKLLALENPTNYKIVYAWKQVWGVNDKQERYEPTTEEYAECKLLLQQLKGTFHQSEETKHKISEANKGKHYIPQTEAQKQHLREINTGKLNPNYGKHRSEKTKRKISESNKGKVASEETRRKLSISHLGNKSALGHRLSNETKALIGEKSGGHIISEETRQKKSAAQKGCIPWNKGLTKETDERVAKMYKTNLENTEEEINEN